MFSKFRIASEEYVIIEKEIKEILSENDINMTILRPTMIYGDVCDRNMSIENNGDTAFLPGTLVDVLDYTEENQRRLRGVKNLQKESRLMLGITKASGNQLLLIKHPSETTKVLTKRQSKEKSIH